MDGTLLRLVEEALDDTLVLRVSGDVCMETAGTLETRIMEAPEQGFRRVVLDLSELHFMDSSGVRVLLQTRQWLDGALVLHNVPPPARRVLEITGVADLLLGG